MNTKKTSDIDIFEGIVSQYQDRLFRFAFMRVGVRETAEDIVQDVMIRLFSNMRDGKKIQNYEFFLLRSISNACIDYLRRKKTVTVKLEEIANTPDDADRNIDEEFIRVSHLLDGLPLEQAETVRLKCYDALTFKQIASLHGISEATVKSRYRYAIQRIRMNINKDK